MPISVGTAVRSMPTISYAPTLEAILTAVLNRVDEILADPITEVLEMLPQLANFIDKGGIQIFVYQ